MLSLHLHRPFATSHLHIINHSGMQKYKYYILRKLICAKEVNNMLSFYEPLEFE